jgi:ribosome maturation factor RimP
MGAETEFIEALRPIVAANGLEIWDVERSGASVRVLVDRPGGVDLDSLATLSGVLSQFLDERDDLVPAGRYELDVSSPGLERRLRSPDHFARCVGQEVAVKTAYAVDGLRRFQGTLVAADGDEVAIVGEADDGTELKVRLPLASVERAHTVFRWGPAPKGPKPGKGRAHAARSGAKVDSAVGGTSEEGR